MCVPPCVQHVVGHCRGGGAKRKETSRQPEGKGNWGLSTLNSLQKWPLPHDALERSLGMWSTCVSHLSVHRRGIWLSLGVLVLMGGSWWLSAAPRELVPYSSFRPGSQVHQTQQSGLCGDWGLCGQGLLSHPSHLPERASSSKERDVCAAGIFLFLKSTCALQLNWNNLFSKETEKPYLFSSTSSATSKVCPRFSSARCALLLPSYPPHLLEVNH